MVEVKSLLYSSLQTIIQKTGKNYPGVIADQFVNCTFEQEETGATIIQMAGMHLLLQHMSG